MNDALVAALEAAGVSRKYGHHEYIATDLPRIASTVGAWPEEVKHVLFRLLLPEVVLDANPVALTKAALNIRAWEEGHLIRLELVAALLSLLAPTDQAVPDA